MPTEFKIPELGENISAGDVLRVLVKAGDTLEKDQPVLELETDKATIEVPSSVAGQVKEIKVKQGDKVKVGQAILTVEDGGTPQKAAAPAEGAPAHSKPAPGEPKAAPAGPKPARGAAVTPTAEVPEEQRFEEVPEEQGLEQHAAGAKREKAADKPGVIKQTTQEAEPTDVTARTARPPGPSRKVVDISRGARAAAEPAATEMPPAPAAPSE